MRLGAPLLPTTAAPPAVSPLPAEAAAAVRAELAGRVLSEMLLVLDPDGIHVESREERARLLRRAGAYELSRAIRAAVVPRGSILVFVDSERGTNITTVDVDTFLGPPSHDVAPRTSFALSPTSRSGDVPTRSNALEAPPDSCRGSDRDHRSEGA